MDNSWVFDLETKIYSVIKVRTEKLLKSKYPNIYFTTTNNPKDATTHYPTVYIHELVGSEKGRTNEYDLNGITYAMQIEVITNTSQKDAKTVINEIAKLFKAMGFEIKSFPVIDNGDTYYRSVMRVSKVIGSDDILV